MSLNIIGISAHFHDSACCLLQDGKLVAAAQEERFSRIKHDSNLPKSAFLFCLKQAHLTLPDINCIAYYEDPRKKLDRQLWMGLPQLPPKRRNTLFRFDAMRPEREIREILGFEGPLEFVEHHQAHAASSYYFSGFPDAAIFTADGVGEWTTTSYGHGLGKDLTLFEEVHFPDSLGLLYSAITAYLGFDVNDAEYKVMGLAPYGLPKYVDTLYRLIELKENGQFRLRMNYFDFLQEDNMYSDELCTLLGRPPRQPESELCQFDKDVACSLQVVLEEVLLSKVRYLYSRVSSQHLCMAGGIALNCVANGRIAREGPFQHLFVQPASSDAGGALGAAALAHVRLSSERPEQYRMTHVYLGPGFSSKEVHTIFEPSSAKFEDFRRKEAELLLATVDRLAAGEVIGWFQGRMEFGPRALGARSILADPRDPHMRDHINALVKKRETFRPFAPAVLDTRAADHFDLDHSSPFMLETCQVRSPLHLPAITHVDGSSRIQTVDVQTCPRFYKLLEAFERRTGCPMLLNTSFNLRGEPIVCTPIDALLCFIRSDIDCLVIEDFLLDRASLPEAWINWFRDTSPQGSNVSRTVYTLL